MTQPVDAFLLVAFVMAHGCAVPGLPVQPPAGKRPPAPEEAAVEAFTAYVACGTPEWPGVVRAVDDFCRDPKLPAQQAEGCRRSVPAFHRPCRSAPELQRAEERGPGWDRVFDAAVDAPVCRSCGGEPGKPEPVSCSYCFFDVQLRREADGWRVVDIWYTAGDNDG